jgi:uridylate kinase
MYKRVLIKISGEQLSGQHEVGIDTEMVNWLAREIKTSIDQTGCQIVMVIGGGNMVRGASVAGNGIRRVTGDHMGMLSGMINAMAVTDIFEANGISARHMSNIFADQVAEQYSYRRAEKHLEQNRVLIVSAGLGRPYFTHDTAAVNIGLELGAEVVIKTTKVDGVYDKDPAKYSDAVRYDSLTFDLALSNPEIKVMDRAALGLAAEQQMQLLVFNLADGTIATALKGDKIGTLIN